MWCDGRRDRVGTLMATADQTDTTATAPNHDPAPHQKGAPDPEKRTGREDEVSDTGGDSDPTAAAGSEPTGEEQAAKNRSDESPS